MSDHPATDTRHVLRLERTFSAPRARVFQALTDPAIIQQWSAPDPLRVGEVSNDARVGGRWLIEMIQDEAGARYVAVGRYLEIDRPSRLRYTHAWLEGGESPEDTDARATIVTIELHDEGPRTRMVFTQTGFRSVETRDSHEEGWDSAFEKLGALLETDQAGAGG